MIVATGMDDTVFFSGVTIRVDGAIPNEQVHIAPPSTQNPISYLHPASSSCPTAAMMTSVGVPSIRLARSPSAICAYLTRFNRISPTTPSSGRSFLFHRHHIAVINSCLMPTCPRHIGKAAYQCQHIQLIHKNDQLTRRDPVYF